MKIIPAIDIIDGSCVRLTQGDYNTIKIYRKDPVEVAKELEDHGLMYLHLVDLDGAKAKQVVNYQVLQDIAVNTRLKIDFGGGIRRTQDVKKVFDSGADKINVGSVAVQDEDMFLGWLEAFGPDKIILSADCKQEKIALEGWVKHSTADVLDFISTYEKKGVKQVTCTDISKDGTMQGPAIQLYEKILAHTDITLLASGGVSSMADISALQAIGCHGVILGKAIYEGAIGLKELAKLC